MSTPEILELVLLLLACVGIGMSAARHLPIPYPVLLVIAGLLVSFVPGLPPMRLDPELVFFVFLPPVLWSAAFFTSLRDFKANVRPITLLAVVLVLATTAAVAVCARYLIPELSWAAAIALGAIVSPPDAVSATSVVRALGVPRRVVTILEGESLVNDATALILYRAAVVAMVTGAFAPANSLAAFVLAATGGVAIGFAVGQVTAFVRKHATDVPTQILITLMAPYFAWLVSERFHASAVLACVVGGIVLRRAPMSDVAPQMRLQARPVWELSGFVINGVLFLLIGLQLRSLATAIPAGGLGVVRLIGHGVVISAVVIAVRLVCVPIFAWVPRRLSAALRARDPMPDRASLFVISWTGLRGIVSLAAAVALPFTLADGSPLPYRAELVLLTFVVIFCTLVLQGLSLAPLIRRLRFPVDEELACEDMHARSEAARSALARIEELRTESWAEAGTLAPLREQYEDRLRRANDGEMSRLSDRAVKRARFESLLAERTTLVRLRDEEVISDDVLMVLEAELDLEAARHGLAELRYAEALTERGD